MRNLIAILGFAAALALAGCAGPSPSPEGTKEGCACCAKDASKPMACDKKEHSGGCCSKGGAKAPAGEGHQH